MVRRERGREVERGHRGRRLWLRGAGAGAMGARGNAAQGSPRTRCRFPDAPLSDSAQRRQCDSIGFQGRAAPSAIVGSSDFDDLISSKSGVGGPQRGGLSSSAWEALRSLGFALLYLSF